MDQIKLTHIMQADYSTLLTWINQRERVLTMGSYRPIHEVNHKQWFDTVLKDKNQYNFAIRTINDELIGTCKLHNFDHHGRSAEVALKISNNTIHGKGIGSESMKKLVAFGFKDLNLHRIFGVALSSNIASIKMCQRAGMRIEGQEKKSIFIDGEYRDMTRMAILQEEYKDA